MIHRCSRGASEHNTGCVIGAIDETAPGTFDVFNTRVVGLDLARRSTGHDEDSISFHHRQMVRQSRVVSSWLDSDVEPPPHETYPGPATSNLFDRPGHTAVIRPIGKCSRLRPGLV